MPPKRRNRQAAGPRKLTGFILPEIKPKDEEAEDSGEEVEEEQPPEFLDTTEIERVASGGQLFHSSVPLCTGQCCYLFFNFHATLRVKLTRKPQFMVSW